PPTPTLFPYTTLFRSTDSIAQRGLRHGEADCGASRPHADGPLASQPDASHACAHRGRDEPRGDGGPDIRWDGELRCLRRGLPARSEEHTSELQSLAYL